jgi:hypothetical protein
VPRDLARLKTKILEAIKVQIRHPFEENRLRVGLNNAHKQAEVVTSEASLVIDIKLLQLQLQGLHRSNKIANKNIPTLYELHQRLCLLEQRDDGSHA